MNTEEIIAMLDAACRLVPVVYDWLTEEAHEQPISACMVALASMVSTQPQVRANLVAKCRTNPVLRDQLLALCDAYREQHPTFASLEKELEHAAG